MRTAAALAVGILLTVLAYPPAGLWPLGFVMLAPLAGLVDGASVRRAFVFAWLYTVTMAVAIVHWLLHALVVEYEVAPLSAVAFLALLVCACALLPASAVALYACLARSVSARFAPLLFGALYVLAEWVRAEPLALPWILAGQTWTPAPLLLQSAEWGGVYAPGFGAVVVGAGIGIAWCRRTASALVAPAAVLLGLVSFGAARLAVSHEVGPGIDVGIVQSAVPLAERSRAGSAYRNLVRHTELTRELAAAGPLDLIVWSETAVDADLDATPGLARSLRTVAGESRALLVTGAPRSAAGRPTHAAVSFDARGLRTSYDKQRLVPFSESDPGWIGFLAPLLGPVTASEPLVAGTEPTLFDGVRIPFAAPICFEITDPGLIRELRANGAGLLVNLSNDAWFGRTGFADLYFGHAVLRAIELRTWVVRGAGTGISAVVDPAGRVPARLGAFEDGVLRARVHSAAEPTLYARHGAAPLLVGLGLVVAVGSARGVRHRIGTGLE